MINTKRPNTDDYTQVGFIEAKDNQGNYQNIDKIYDNQGNIVFQQGYLNEYQGADDFGISAIGKPLIDYTIYGNSVQNGTPTPDNPIEPEFVGELVTEGEYAGQYVIPISSAGQTKNIYLGQVQTTRRIKKLALTGEETTWVTSPNSLFSFKPESSPATLSTSSDTALSNCYAPSKANTIYLVPDMSVQCGVNGRLWLTDSRFNESTQRLTDFKAYLAQQYAAGTPVIVWYVLAEPEVGIVNEPLCRIGDYADSVDFSQAGIEIPTLNKPNTTVIDVETSLEPSEVDVTYRGATKQQYDLFLAQNGNSFEAQDGQSLYIGGNV